MNLLDQLRSDYPEVLFIESDTFMWSPSDSSLHYCPEILSSRPGATYTLLHELGHALCQHSSYHADTELVSMELEAWQKAKEISKDYAVEIPTDHIEDCLDTYRDWLLARATCPDCNLAGLQSLRDLSYSCYNCNKAWTVPENQTCIVRRRVLATT